MVEKCTANDQCESEEAESEQPRPIIPTASVCLQLMQTYDDDAQMHHLQQLEDFIKKKIFDAYKQCKITNFFSPNV